MTKRSNPPTLRDVSTSYAKAADRLAELEAKRESLRAELAELERRMAEAEHPDADALLTASDLDTALAGPDSAGLQAQASDIQRQLQTVQAALSKARQAVEAETRTARRKVGAKVSKQYSEIARRQALALVELGLAHEKYNAFQRDLPGSVAECGLTQYPLNPMIGNSTTDGLFARLIADAVEAGFIKASDVPHHWPINRKKAA